MIRQAPIAQRPSQRHTHPKNKRKAAKGDRCVKFLTCVVLIVVIVAIITLPSGFLVGLPQIAYVITPSILKGGVDNLYSMGYDFLPPHSLHSNKTTSRHVAIARNASVQFSNDEKTSLYNPDGTKKRRIAYAITISKDGSFQDGAAILAFSIYEASKNFNDIISFVAFVHPRVVTSRPALKRLGFHVIEGNIITNDEKSIVFSNILSLYSSVCTVHKIRAM